MTEVPPNRVLRNLPGVAEVEALLKRVHHDPNYKWSKEWEEAERLAERVSKRLFGLSSADTQWTPEDLEYGWSEEAWRYQFRKWGPPDSRGRILAEDYDPAELGWDVTDGEGRTLLCAGFFHGQLVCVAKDLAGHEAGAALSDEELEDEAEEWAAALLRKPGDGRAA